MNDTTFTTLVWCLYVLFSCTVLYVLFRWYKAKDPHASTKATSLSSPAAPLRTVRKGSGLQSDISKEGTGPGAKNRDMLTVHYEAWLVDGTKVDSSYDRGKTLTFKLGTAAVIFGWDEALIGAKVGEKRKITVPPQYAYGRKGTSKIPPDSTVIFDVEILKIEPK